MTTIEPSIIISLVALLLSMFSIYRQWIKPRHPKIAFLINPDEMHRSVLRPYKGLPPKYQQEFPEYPTKYPGYVIVNLPFGNTGDEAGLVKIFKVDIQNPPGWSKEDRIEASFYNHCVVPAGDLVLHPIVLRNIPAVNDEQIVKLTVAVEWGEPDSRTGAFVRKGGKEYPLQVRILPSADVIS